MPWNLLHASKWKKICADNDCLHKRLLPGITLAVLWRCDECVISSGWFLILCEGVFFRASNILPWTVTADGEMPTKFITRYYITTSLQSVDLCLTFEKFSSLRKSFASFWSVVIDGSCNLKMPDMYTMRLSYFLCSQIPCTTWLALSDLSPW